MSRILIALGTLLVLAVIDVSIYGKEKLRRNGEIVLLELAPVDPRSLMQGDYMALRFRLAQEIEGSWHTGVAPSEGETRTVAVTVDAERVAKLAAKVPGSTLPLRYRVRQGAAWLGTNAFFFEEGGAKRFAGARYGEFRIDRESGEAMLVALRGANREPL